MIILLHTSKTMVPTPSIPAETRPQYIDTASELAAYIRSLDTDELQKAMHVSPALAAKIQKMYAEWGADASRETAAVVTFRGDIYSGLRALEFTEIERAFASQHLRIISALYGILRPYDAVSLYRLEAAYKFAEPTYKDLYKFWGDKLAQTLPPDEAVINLTSVEYEKLVLPHTNNKLVIAPRFLTRKTADSEPTFVVVHAKIARGAFARWLIQRQRDDVTDLQDFTDLGYAYAPSLSTEQQPTYICTNFGGTGLSQRLIKD